MKKYLPIIILAVLALLPFLGLSSYVMHILVLVVMWSVIGMAWNVLGGYTG
ncbi:MAG: inner-rane translocator, partial [Deltaproteobacteria bacterium]|nr:inner-rane translocator [Deltaproteobacteria bacterium]